MGEWVDYKTEYPDNSKKFAASVKWPEDAIG